MDGAAALGYRDARLQLGTSGASEQIHRGWQLNPAIRTVFCTTLSIETFKWSS